VADLTIPHPDERIALEDGRINRTWYDKLNSLFRQYTETTRDLSTAETGLTGKAALTQTEYGCWTFQFPEDVTENLALNLAYAWTITKVTTKTRAGTATVTVKIGGVALGGTANSASTSEQEQEHSSSNVAAAGSDVQATLSSVSSDCEGLSIAIEGTRTLAAA
jgi:hypothetical protein